MFESWGICVSRVPVHMFLTVSLFIMTWIVFMLSCKYIMQIYKSYCANLESRVGSWIIIMDLGKNNDLLLYLCTFAIYLHKNINIFWWTFLRKENNNELIHWTFLSHCWLSSLFSLLHAPFLDCRFSDGSSTKNLHSKWRMFLESVYTKL